MNKKNMPDQKAEKMKTGIKGFDQLFQEGIPVGNAVVIEGGPGSGKTTFSLQIAHEACKQGKKVLFMSFEEPEYRLRQHMADYGWEPEKYEDEGLLYLKRFQSLDISRSVEALLSEAKKELLIDIQPVLIPKEFQPDVICIDSLTSIMSTFSGEEFRFRVYIEQLFRYLESHHITSFLVREVSHPTHIGIVHNERENAIDFLADGIIGIYNVIFADGTRDRAIEVIKMRGDDIDRRIVEAKIVHGKGFVVNSKYKLEGSYKLT